MQNIHYNKTVLELICDWCKKEQIFYENNSLECLETALYNHWYCAKSQTLCEKCYLPHSLYLEKLRNKICNYCQQKYSSEFPDRNFCCNECEEEYNSKIILDDIDFLDYDISMN